VNKFKTGVSDWTLTFENNQVIKLIAILQENVVMYSGGKVYIVLINAVYDDKLVETFYALQTTVSHVNQKFNLRDNLGKVIEQVEYNYDNMKVKYMMTEATSSSVATIRIIMKNF
jgi:hypothetical protein